jgi:hypothetical protein
VFLLTFSTVKNRKKHTFYCSLVSVWTHVWRTHTPWQLGTRSFSARLLLVSCTCLLFLTTSWRLLVPRRGTHHSSVEANVLSVPSDLIRNVLTCCCQAKSAWGPKVPSAANSTPAPRTRDRASPVCIYTVSQECPHDREVGLPALLLLLLRILQRMRPPRHLPIPATPMPSEWRDARRGWPLSSLTRPS